MRLTRRYRFSASHRLHTIKLTGAENVRIYGKCNNPFGHGHDYVLDVSVKGPVDSATGRAVDLDTLDGLVQREILEPFEHRNLNTDVPAFSAIVPTTENLAVEIKARLDRCWASEFPAGHPALDRIRVYETKRNIFELS